MGRNKGICTLCGKGRKLTFEHVPPQDGGNERGLKMHSLEEWLARESFDGPPSGGVPQPEGMGLEALCKPCNEFLGTNYVPAHTRLVRAGQDVLEQISVGLAEYDARERITYLTVLLKEIDRLACAKQIVAMLLVTSGRGVAEAHPQLPAFVLDPSARGLPADYRLALAVAPGPAATSTGLVAAASPEQGLRTAIEVVYPPFRYAMSVTRDRIWRAGDITGWGHAKPGQNKAVFMRLALGFTHSGIPCDLSTRAMLERASQAE